MRVEFRLTMPNVGSWNGKWSGEGKDYLIVRNLSEKQLEPIIGRSFHHSWGDGWGANVSVRAMEKGERARKSAGFCGYDWMVTNIIQYGSTRKPELERDGK